MTPWYAPGTTTREDGVLAIVRMISRDIAEFREFQARLTTVGKIRLGVYATPEGKRGRPEKIDTFRFTADNEALIRAVAEQYGGEVGQWTPQGSSKAQWQVITDANAVEVYVVNGQRIDPVYEAWAGGRTCVRRCDGVLEQIKSEPCLCNGPDRPQNPRDLCKPTVRVQVMLQRIQGLGSWLLESHGENACMELAMFGPFVASAPMPVPALLRLRRETRRQWNAEKDKFDTLEFYVPWFDISVVSARQVAIGGDALTQALAAAGAPAAIGGSPQHALAAVAEPSAEPPVEQPPLAPDQGISDELRAKILRDIEAQDSPGALLGIQAKLKGRGITDQAVKDAWRSKFNALEAHAQAGQAPSEPEYAVGDTVVVGGIEFTKISDNPFPSGSEAAQLAEQIEAEVQAEMARAEAAEIVEGTVEGDGSGLPMLPDGSYGDFNTELPKLMALAGQRTPPLNTDQLREVIIATFELPKASDASGYQLAQLAEAMRQGLM